jgi:arylsulfatase A-like enzyme
MLRTDRYKYIWKSDQQHELYDLVQDPGELVNLIAVRPEVARQMGKQLEAWHRSLENHAIETSQIEYDEVMVERLRQLGYVE